MQSFYTTSKRKIQVNHSSTTRNPLTTPPTTISNIPNTTIDNRVAHPSPEKKTIPSMVASRTSWPIFGSTYYETDSVRGIPDDPGRRLLFIHGTLYVYLCVEEDIYLRLVLFLTNSSGFVSWLRSRRRRCIRDELTTLEVIDLVSSAYVCDLWWFRFFDLGLLW